MTLDAAKDTYLGRLISHYQIVAKLGQGSMGVVYKALDTKLHRSVAIKFLTANLLTDPSALQRFQYEAVAASAINHPNICIIYEIDVVLNDYFIVMEFVEGMTLGTLLAEKRILPEQQVIQYVSQLCSALAAAHQIGLVHRDIKPDNILLCDRTGQVKLTDFGLAKLASEAVETGIADLHESLLVRENSSHEFIPNKRLSTYSSLSGTPAYMSPEQVRGEAVDRRTDIFSLGIVIHELLTGHLPFNGDDAMTILKSIAFQEPDFDLGKHHFHWKWRTVLAKSMAKEKEARYQSIEELTADLPDPGKTQVIGVGKFGKKAKGGPSSHWVLAATFVILITIGWLYIKDSGSRNSVSFSSKAKTTVSDDPIRHFREFYPRSQDVFHHFQLGLKAFSTHWDMGAIENLQTAVEQDSTFAYANALMATILMWNERPDEAQKAFLQAERNISFATSWEQLLIKGYLARWRNQTGKAIGYFSQAVTKRPQLIDSYLGAFTIHEIVLDYEAAIKACQQIIKMDSNYILAYGRIADYSMRRGDYITATKYAQKEIHLMKISGDSTALDIGYQLLGRTFHLLGKGDSAILALEKSIVLSPRNRDTYQFLAEAYALQGNLAKAERLLRDLLAWPFKPRERSQVYEWLTWLMLFSGRYADALFEMQKCKRLCLQEKDYPQFMVYSSVICYIYLVIGQPVMAEKELAESVTQLTDKRTLFVNLVEYHNTRTQFRIAIAKGDSESAHKKLQRLMRMSNDKSGGLYENAIYAMALGKYDEAKAILQKRITANKRFDTEQQISLKYDLAKIYATERNYNKAIEYGQQALGIRRILTEVGAPLCHWKIVNLLSSIYETVGEIEKAKELCHRYFAFHQNADPELLMTMEMIQRYARLEKMCAKP